MDGEEDATKFLAVVKYLSIGPVQLFVRCCDGSMDIAMIKRLNR